MKYTQEQLKDIAINFLYYYHSGDHRADVMLHIIHQITGMQPHTSLSEIQKLAEYIK